jgi:hypothetical protein
MAITAVGQVRFAALAGAPELPQGYHFEAIRDTPNGVRVDVHFKGARIFEIAAELKYTHEYDDPVGTRYAARVVEDRYAKKRAFNHPSPWIEYDNITALIHAMITRHRIGVNNGR